MLAKLGIANIIALLSNDQVDIVKKGCLFNLNTQSNVATECILSWNISPAVLEEAGYVRAVSDVIEGKNSEAIKTILPLFTRHVKGPIF